MQQSPTNDTASAGAVYVQTNAAPNEVIAFRRADDGSLDRIGSVATGGEGDEAASALKSEARRRVGVGAFFGHIAYVSIIARKPS